MFFIQPQAQNILAEFVRKVDYTSNLPTNAQQRLSMSQEIVRSIISKPESWDERCQYVIKQSGNKFLDALSSFDSKSPKYVDNIMVFSYRLLIEYEFNIEEGYELNPDLSAIKAKVQVFDGESDDFFNSRITQATYLFPAQLIKRFLQDPNIQNFKAFEENAKKAEELKQEWDKELAEKKKAVKQLSDKLDSYKTAFNFVGLYKGFESLVKEKRNDESSLLKSLIGMGLLIVAPLVFELFYAAAGVYNGKALGTDHLVVFLALISIEFILIYFFRVVLQNYRSVKTQIMQIELRQTLCQFIQSYAEYSCDIKKQNGSALDKFESLIFSGILSDTEKLPSTFDGLDQLGSIMKSLKGTS